MTTTPVLDPGSPEWYRVITASKVAAILGAANPNYSSARALWHLMRGDVTPEAQTDVQARGHYLEPAILAWWRDQHPELTVWRQHPTFYLADWAAATPEAIAGPEDSSIATRATDGSVLVEAKSQRDLDEWGDPGTDQIPLQYLCQAWWQMHLSGVHTTYVPVIGPFLDFAEYVVTYDPEIGAALETTCRAFYDSLTGDTAPPLDDAPATYQVLRRLHAAIQPKATADLSVDQAREFIDAKNGAAAADARLRMASATVLDVMGDSQYGVCAGITVARRQPAKGGSIALYQVAKTTDQLPGRTEAA